MKKTAVFVEGQTELIFVRECLLKWFSYNAAALGFDCYNLRNSELSTTPYRFGNDNCDQYFMIINVGNDNTVLSTIKKRYKSLSSRYQTIVGLRDMYCEPYKKAAKGHGINAELNNSFIQAAMKEINQFDDSNIIGFHFAIMEVETWLLTLKRHLSKMDKRLSDDFIFRNTGIDLNDDLERTLFHPTAEMKRIYALVGMVYNKHEAEIMSIMSMIEKSDIEQLAESGKCLSFRAFMESLLGFIFD